MFPQSQPLNGVNQQQVQQTLLKYWGYSHFRPLQGEIVAALLQQQDLLAVLPTGAGKSLCFQLPALLRDGLSLVVSPLVALMENQVAALQAKTAPAALYHSEQSREQRRQVLSQLDHEHLKLLYLSPESLLTPAIWNRLLNLKQPIESLTVDEAHCITQWGSSFRPTYRRLGSIRSALSSPPFSIAAFTATADVATQQEIQSVLELRHPRMFRSSPYRKNLTLNVRRVWSPASRRQGLKLFIEAQGKTTGLVYTRSRRESEFLADWLTQQGHSTEAYHAGLSPDQRRHIERQWLSGKTTFVVCTSAFGMGVDHPQVRWVCHFHAPSTLAEYVQEIGRAGRDGQSAQTLLLASEPTGWLDPQDRERRLGFERQIQTQQRLAQSLIPQLPQEGTLAEVLQTQPQAELALAILHQQQRLTWIDPFRYCLRKSVPPAPPQPNQTKLEDYLVTRHCRWQFLLKAFGFEREAQNTVCGHCDRCLAGQANSI